MSGVVSDKPPGGKGVYGLLDGHTVRLVGGQRDRALLLDISPEGFGRLQGTGAQLVSVGSAERRRIGGLNGAKPDFVRCKLPLDKVKLFDVPDGTGDPMPVTDGKSAPAQGGETMPDQRKAHLARLEALVVEKGPECRPATVEDFVGRKAGDHTFIVCGHPGGIVVRHDAPVDSAQSVVSVRLNSAGITTQGVVNFFTRTSRDYAGTLKVERLYTTPFKDTFSTQSLKHPENRPVFNEILAYPAEIFWGTSDPGPDQPLPSWATVPGKLS